MSSSRETVRVYPADAHQSLVFSFSSAVRHINPLDMTPDVALFLGRLLSACSASDYAYIDDGLWRVVFYCNGVQSEECYISLDHSILLRMSESHPDEYRGEILGSHIGFGSFGNVYRVLGTLIPTLKSDGSVQHKQSLRVVKVQQCTNGARKKQVESEAKIGRRTAYLGAKQPIHVGKISFSVLRYLKGIDLYDFIARLDNPFDFYTVDEALQVVLNILYAVKEQLHDRGIVSRDIKPENMMLNECSDEIFNFDMGLAKFAAKKDVGSFVGTSGYCSPEVCDGSGSTKQSDIFAAGITIGLVLGAEQMRVDTDHQKKQAAYEVIFNDIFKHFPELAPHHRDRLLNMLESMTTVKPFERVSIRQAISIVENIILERKLESVPDTLHSDMRKAYHCAVTLRDKLDPACGWNVDGARRTYDTFSLMNKLVNELEAGLKEALDGFSDDPASVELFMAALRFRLPEASTKSDICTKTRELIALYKQENKKVTTYLNSMLEQIGKARMKGIAVSDNISQEISMLFSVIDMRLNQYLPIINNLPLWCKKLTKMASRVSSLKDRVDEVLAVSKLARRPSFLTSLSVFACPAMSSDGVAWQKKIATPKLTN